MDTDLKQKEQALLCFLDDIDCLDKLSTWVDALNIFDILKLARTEIRHSNMLAWLLDPNANHGLGYSFLYGVLCKLPNLLPPQSQDGMLDIDFLSLLSSADFSSFRVRREWNNIDLLIISDKREEIIAIENKIDSGLGRRKNGDTQLDDYDEAIKKNYNGWKWARILLSPDQSRFEKDFDNRSKVITWGRMEYKDISLILEHCINKNRQTLIPEVSILLNNYLRLLKKEIDMDNNDLIRICNEIYRQHKGALDLIYDNRNDLAQPVADICHEWLNDKVTKQLIIKDNSTGRKFIKFRSNRLNAYFNGNDTKHYYYQIDIRPEDKNQAVRVQFALVFYKDENDCLSDDLKEKMHKVIKAGSKKNKTNDFNRWRTVSSYIEKFSVSYDKDFDQKEKVKDFIENSFVTIENSIPTL